METSGRGSQRSEAEHENRINGRQRTTKDFNQAEELMGENLRKSDRINRRYDLEGGQNSRESLF